MDISYHGELVFVEMPSGLSISMYELKRKRAEERARERIRGFEDDASTMLLAL